MNVLRATTGTGQVSGPWPTAAEEPAPGDAPRARVWDLVGGLRGAVDGGLPPLVFVAANALVGAYAARSTALAAAIATAVSTGLGIVVLRLARKETPKQALAGLAGLAIAILFAVGSGEARGFFLPGIYVDAAYAVVLAASAALGRPLIGTLYGLLFGRREWRTDARLRRLFVLATLGWSVVYAVRASAQAFLYREDLPGLLAFGKLLLGWPLTALAVALTLAGVRRATRHADRDGRVAFTG
ncbi:DUF3159 domain-containing protein [Blastococcus mobilis]|uniref:DUF3159 domain-containing protein n=1 Tax=Blastococcus mobilis TaxID=1938746 RepID=A0A238UVZ3_9ACTN|nr:DUF3159 domain-containing protein [Blastococcus mobilis]SNR25513.1 Protein of unknown function [Blastococcus mobilis]